METALLETLAQPENPCRRKIAPPVGNVQVEPGTDGAGAGGQKIPAEVDGVVHQSVSALGCGHARRTDLKPFAARRRSRTASACIPSMFRVRRWLFEVSVAATFRLRRALAFAPGPKDRERLTLNFQL